MEEEIHNNIIELRENINLKKLEEVLSVEISYIPTITKEEVQLLNKLKIKNINDFVRTDIDVVVKKIEMTKTRYKDLSSNLFFNEIVLISSWSSLVRSTK